MVLNRGPRTSALWPKVWSDAWVSALLILPWIHPWAPSPQSNTLPVLISWACLGLLAFSGHMPAPLTVARAWVWAALISSAMGLVQYFGQASHFGGLIHVPAYLGDAVGNVEAGATVEVQLLEDSKTMETLAAVFRPSVSGLATQVRTVVRSAPPEVPASLLDRLTAAVSQALSYAAQGDVMARQWSATIGHVATLCETIYHTTARLLREADRLETLERMLKDVPGSTVRANRLELARKGLIVVAGIGGKGRRKYRTWRLAS